MASSYIASYHLEYLDLLQIFYFFFPSIKSISSVLNFIDQDQKFHVNSLKYFKYTGPLASLFLKTCGHSYPKPVMILII